MRINVNKYLKHALVALPLFGLLAASSSAPAAAIIDIGNITLAPDTPGQAVQIFITGDSEVIAGQFNLQLGDGGEAGLGEGPFVESVDLLTGTIFGTADEPVQFDNVMGDRLWQSEITTGDLFGPDPLPPVTTNGLLATIYVSTVGQSPGTYDLLLANVLGTYDTFLLDENLGEIDLTIVNGTATIAIPEPSVVLAGLAGTCLLLRRRSR